MTITVEIIDPIVGPSHTFAESDVANWADIIDLITTDPCDFVIEYDGQEYAGAIAKSNDGLSLLVAFEDDLIALPSGMCLIVTCEDEDPGEDGCYPNEITQLNLTDRLMVTDENGCPIGNVSLQTLVDFIEGELNIPGTLCDLLGGPIPEGNLVAQDRIVTTSDGCNLKSVPQSDVVCN